MKTVKVLLTVLLALGLLAGCAQVPTPTQPTAVVPATVSAKPTAAPARGGGLIIATAASSEPALSDGQVDPYVMTWLLDSFVTDPLVLLTPEGEYKPMLATGWVLSPDGKTLTLTLRKGIKFQDGTPFNAEAVKFNIDRVMDPNTHSLLMADNLGVKQFKATEVVDEFTVRIVYNAPVPSVFYGLSVCPMWSPTAVKKYGADFHLNLVGTGAFKMTEWVKGSHVKFVKDPNYIGGPPWQEHAGPAYLDSITIKWVGEAAVLGEVLKTGEVNMVMSLPAQSLAFYKSNPDFQVIPAYQPGTGMQFTMNTSRPPLDDIRVRQALRYAYDQDKINQTLYDSYNVAVKAPLTKFSRCYWKGAEDAYKYDPEKAKSLLEEAGWKVNSRTGIREKEGKPLAFTIQMLHHSEIGEYLGTPFRAIGVDLKMEVIPGPVSQQRAASGEFDFMYERLRHFEPDVLYSVWYSKNTPPGGWAWSRFQNDKLDEVLLKTQSTADPDERCKLFIEAQKMVTEFALALPTVDDAVYFAMPKSVKGFKLGVASGGWFFVNDMYVEK
jgi:peptide/nickel transport system substrate-binding protein